MVGTGIQSHLAPSLTIGTLAAQGPWAGWRDDGLTGSSWSSTRGKSQVLQQDEPKAPGGAEKAAGAC